MPLVPHTLSKQASKRERERECVCVWGRVRVNTVSASTIFHTASSPQNAVDAVSGVWAAAQRCARVLWFEVYRHQDATATDEGAVQASIPWALGCCRCGGWYSSAACFDFVVAAVCSERRTWVNLQKPVRSATGPRDRESQRCECFCTASSPLLQNAVGAVGGACSVTAAQRCAVCCGLKYVVIRMPLSPMRAL